VQFGAFKGPIRAEALRLVLAQKGLAARVDKVSEATGEVLYKVRVGFYQIKSQALAEQKRLKQATGMECFVARARQP
jgi:cell division protein FtsN